MTEQKPKRYFRITRAERSSIERALKAKKPIARSMAKDLGRSATSITEEVKRNRVVAKGPGKGERVDKVPEDACARLQCWPWVCNGCKLWHYHCSKKWRCEYSAARAQALSEELLVLSRRGVNAHEFDFEAAMSKIRTDIGNGLSPAQIAYGRKDELDVSPSTIYRWIAAGYGGMSNAELRRKVGYKPRKKHKERRITSHGAERSYAAFCALSQDERDSACEMDTVIGRKSDSRCILTLYLRPSKTQLCLLLPEKSSSAVAAALDMLEGVLGHDLFQRLFGVILTDNGTEFADADALERPVEADAPRTQVYYCDPRQSQQKGRCERNHVELRKILPKGRGIPFDKLVAKDMSAIMSHVNSQPRASLMGLSPLAIMKAAMGEDACALLDALGIEEVAYEDLNLTFALLIEIRRERGDEPLA